jgi:hypothetical protein
MISARAALARQQEQNAIESPNRYQLPDNDLYRFLIGAWKRNLEWREYGGSFPYVRTSSTVVLIEEYQRIDNTPGVRHLKWSFGRSLEKADLQFGYIMKFDPKAKNNDVALEWQYTGDLCHGQYIDKSSVVILNFFIRSSTILATYRIIDADTIAVCITEIDEKQKPTIQYGNMYRLDASLYTNSSPSTTSRNSTSNHSTSSSSSSSSSSSTTNSSSSSTSSAPSTSSSSGRSGSNNKKNKN